MSVNNYEQSELLVLYGQTTGAGGTVSLTSDVIVSPQTKFVFPKGMTAKVRTTERTLDCSMLPTTAVLQLLYTGSTPLTEPRIV